MSTNATPANVGSNDVLGRCTCPPGECHGKGHGPANCAAVAARQKPISEARYVSRLEAAARLMIAAPDAAALEHARSIARLVLVWHGDCREVLPLLPEGAGIVSDPPYDGRLTGFTTGRSPN